MNLNLQHKNALVGGASQGIGQAIANELAQLGANVTLVARSEDRLKAVLESLDVSQGQKHRYLIADYSQPESLQTKVEYLVKDNPIHILINNTGGPPAGPAHKADTQEYMAALTQHLICNQILLQAVLPGMKSAQYGRVINIISTSVKQPLDNLGVSNTTRGAVANWAKTLSNELGVFGITVNNVLPGATETGRLQSIISNKAEKAGLKEEDVVHKMQSSIPVGRFAKPEEVAAAAAFLASPAAAYINGINLPVDGGRTKCL